MIEFLIENIDLQTQKDKEFFLDKLESELLENPHEFVIINSAEKFDLIKTKKIVNEIKRHFDIFIILKTKLPNKFKELEKFFSSGIHGIFFWENKNQIKNINILREAGRIFTTGTVFYETSTENKDDILKLIDNNIIPVLKNRDSKLLNLIEINLNKKRNLKGYLKFIPLIEGVNNEYSFNLIRERGFKEKVEKKIILELNNLRQKLMIKEIEDSFNSSAL